MVEVLTADADLFDIVKGKLLDEGLTEKESIDVMLTLTLFLSSFEQCFYFDFEFFFKRRKDSFNNKWRNIG